MIRREGITTGGLITGLVVAIATAAAVYVAIMYDSTGQHVAPPGPNAQFDEEIYRLGPIDPAIIKYRKAWTVETGLKTAAGIAIDSAGRLIVVGDQRARILDPRTGQVIATFELPGRPQCVAAAPNERIVIAMHDRVAVWNGRTKALTQFDPLSGPANITSVAATPNGEIFAADSGGRVVVRYSSAGKALGQIGRDEETGKATHFFVPSPHFDVAAGADGLLRIVNPGHHRIETYTADGSLESQWERDYKGAAGFHGCCNPADIALLPDGTVVAGEKGIGLPRVKTYSPNGEFIGVVAGVDDMPQDVFGLDLATDREGRIYVLDGASKTVSVFEKKKDGPTSSTSKPA